MIKEIKESFRILKKSKFNVLIDMGFVFLVFFLVFVFSNLFVGGLNEINNLTEDDLFVALENISPVVTKLIVVLVLFFVFMFLLYCFYGSLQWRWTYNLINKKKGKFNWKYFFKFGLINLVFLVLFYLLFLLLKVSRSDLQILILLFFGLILVCILLMFYVLLNKMKFLEVFKEKRLFKKVLKFVLMYLVVLVFFIVGSLFVWLFGFLPGILLSLILDLFVVGVFLSLSRVFVSLVVDKI